MRWGGGGVGGVTPLPFSHFRVYAREKTCCLLVNQLDTVANLQTELIWLVIQYDLANNRHRRTNPSLVKVSFTLYIYDVPKNNHQQIMYSIQNK